MNLSKTIFSCLFLLSLLFLPNCHSDSSSNIRIATAANMQFAMEALTQTFMQQNDILCEVILSSSGKLNAQIKNGAPFDVFVSADMKYPKDLYKDGFTLNKPKVYATGRLILWSTLDESTPSINWLTQKVLKHIALANPKTAPYGVAAIEVLEKLNIYEQVKDKLVFGENIAQVNQFVTTQAAQVGFTTKAIIYAPHLTTKGYWQEVSSQYYSPIEQGVVLLKSPPTKQKQAQAFYDFLFSKEGKEILESFGYGVSFDEKTLRPLQK